MMLQLCQDRVTFILLILQLYFSYRARHTCIPVLRNAIVSNLDAIVANLMFKLNENGDTISPWFLIHRKFSGNPFQSIQAT